MPGQIETISLFNVPESKQQQQQMLALVQEIVAEINSFTGFSLYGKANGSGDLRKQSTELAGALEKIKALKGELVKMEDQLTAAKQRGASVGKAKTDEEIRNHQKIAAATKTRVDAIKAEGSVYDQLLLKVRAANREARETAAIHGVNSQEFKVAQASALQYQGQLNKINEGLNQHQHNVGNYLGSIKNFFGDLIRQAVAFFGIYQGFEVVKEGVKEFLNAQLQAVRLSNILKNLGRSDAFGRLDEQAEKLSKTFGTFKKEDVTEVFDKLIVYGKLTENQIKSLLPVIINFSAQTGKTLGESTDIFTKAMEGNVRGLREFGIEIQRGNTPAENLAIIMKDLAPRVANAAKEFGESLPGGLKKTEEEIEETKKSIGEKLTPTISNLYTILAGALDGMGDFFNSLKTGFQKLSEFGSLAFDTLKGVAKGGDFSALHKDIKDITDAAQKLADEKMWKEIAAGAKSVGEDVVKKPLEEQKKILASNISMMNTSAQIYNDLIAQGKKNTAAGHQAAQQLATDAATVKAIYDAMAAAKDKRVLGLGDDRPDKKKEIEELADYAKEFQKILDEINSFAEKALGIDVSPLKRELNAAFIEYDKFFMSIRDLRNNDEKDITKKLAEKKITAVQAASQRKIVEEKSTLDLLNLEKAYNANVAAITEKYRREAAEAARKNDEEHFKKQEEMFDKIQALLDKKAKQRFKDDVSIAKANIDDPKSPGTNLQKQKKEFEAEMNLETEQANEQHNHGLISEIEYQELILAIKKRYQDKVRDATVKAVERDIDYARSAIDAVDNLEKAKYERQLNRIQKQIDLNNKLKENETERISTSTLSEQQKANALIVLNARTAAQNEALQRKQRDIKVKEAKFDKDKAVFDIIASTAVGIMRASPNFVLMALTAATGAVELAATLAKPIPTYFKGTDGHPGGPMIVGEQGSELITTPDGKQSLSPDKPTLMYAPKGTEVLTAKETHDKFNDVLLRNVFRQQLPQVQKNEMVAEIKDLKEAIQISAQSQIAAIKKFSGAKINFYGDKEFREYWKRQI